VAQSFGLIKQTDLKRHLAKKSKMRVFVISNESLTMMKKRFQRPLAAFLVLFALCVGQLPQTAAQSATNAYAITNARIVTVSGATIEKGTIVIRDGLINEVGANVTAPADARVIDGAGLTIYPGLIDAHTNLAIPQAQRAPQGAGGPGGAQQQQQPQQTSSGTNYPQGLQPETNAADLIRAGNDQFEQQRNAGITTVLTAPRDGIFMGQSVVINLSGETATQMVVRGPVAQHIGFTPLRGGQYPASTMGVFSAIRQMLLDAGRLREANAIYEKNPKGLRRPEQDKSLVALFPVLEGQMPVVMIANVEREIVRALDLAQEFKLKAIIAGGAESWKVADRLKKMDVPVLLSVNLPKRLTAAVPEADPEPLRVLRARVEAPKTASKLASAGVRFAFQSGGATNMSDYLAGASKTVEGGLSKEAALRAMTLGAAEILGVADRMGSIETGKIANLTIARGDIFDKNTRVTHVFVDGTMFENKTPATPPTAQQRATGPTSAPAAPSIGGTWSLNIDIPGQPVSVTAEIKQEGSNLTGTLQTPFGPAQITSGTVSAEGFSFKALVNVGQAMEVTFTGKITGNQMSGVVNSPQGDAPFTGTKNP
jgi:imidazolonepropionase-like amidohydrolase